MPDPAASCAASWTFAAHLDDLTERPLGVTLARGETAVRVALFRLDDGVFATADLCPHAQARLSEGEVVDGLIECPAHFALFDIRTGRCDGGITDRSVATYPVRIDEGRVFLLV